MSDFSFRLDLKSFYFGVYNDNEKGHTATVNTILKQGSTIKPELSLFQKCDANIDLEKYPELVEQIGRNSKTKTIVQNILVFDKISINGIELHSDFCFAFFLRKEIDPTKVQYGRIKIHYPQSLSFDDCAVHIDNKRVISLMRNYFDGFAFIVRQIDISSGGRLNFRASIVGLEGVPYSKIFNDYRGFVNDKERFNQYTQIFWNTYDFESKFMKERGIPSLGKEITPQNYHLCVTECQNIAKKIAIEKVIEQKPGIEIVDMSSAFPSSLYDFEVWEAGKPTFYKIKWSCSKKVSFVLSQDELTMVNSYNKQTLIVFVSSLLSGDEKVHICDISSLDSFRRQIKMIEYTQL